MKKFISKKDKVEIFKFNKKKNIMDFLCIK
jgi:hypothetical protein